MTVKKDNRDIKVGFFVFVSLTVAFFIIFMIGSNSRVFKSHYTLKCTFSNISGLRIGAPVQLAGVNIGLVDDIRFSKDLLKKDIEVVLSISDEFRDRIRDDSIATINTQGLLGDKYIYISVGSSDQPVLKNNSDLKAKEVVGLFDLAEKGGDILGNLDTTMKDVSSFFSSLSEGHSDVKEAVKSLNNIFKEVEKGKGVLHALVYNPQGQNVVNNLASSLESLKLLLGHAGRGLGEGEVKNITYNLGKTAMNLKEITDKVKNGEGTVGGLISDPTIYNDIRGIFGRANRNSLFKAVVRTTLEENEKQVLK